MKWFVWVGDLGGGAKRYVDPATMEPIPLDPGSLARCTYQQAVYCIPTTQVWKHSL
jgi:hypothetical protein